MLPYTKMTKRALLIGANYAAIPGLQLKGCIDDIVDIHNMLIDAYGYMDSNIIMLRDDNPVPSRLPTRANILSAFASIINSSSTLDEIWIHYSGHGTQIPGQSGMNQVIVPCDFQKSGFVTDKEFYSILANSQSRVLLFFDSCYSGSVCDLQYSINYQNGVYSQVVNPYRAIANPNLIMMSGCRDNQTSADAYDNFEKEYEGAFTNALINTLRQYQHNVDIRNLYGGVCKALSVDQFTQVPVLSFSTSYPMYQFIRAAPSAPSITSIPTVIGGAMAAVMKKGMEPMTGVFQEVFRSNSATRDLNKRMQMLMQ
jgi:hypothetical protein